MDWSGVLEGLRPDFIIPALIALAGLWLNALSIRSQTRNSRIEKIADVLISCSQRFHEIDELGAKLEAGVKSGDSTQRKAAQRFYFEYWHFQWDQWNYFKLGLIPHEIYADWFYQRLVLIRLEVVRCGVPFIDGWKLTRAHFETYEDFRKFVDECLALSGQGEKAARAGLARLVDQAYRSARPMRVGFARRSTGGWL